MVRQINLRECIERNHKEAARSGRDFYVYDISYRTPLGHPFVLDAYGCCICIEGEATGLIDLIPCKIRPMCMVVNVPGRLIEQHTMSEDFKGIGIVMSKSFVRELGFPYDFKLDKMLRESPTVELSEGQYESMLSYCAMSRRIIDSVHPYRNETLYHLTCAFYYGVGSYLYQVSDKRQFTGGEQLMQRFLVEVKEWHKEEHKVEFYARRLNVSLGYFFAVVRRESGKTPSEWIDGYLVGEARALLKGTNLTVKQICYELGFSSQSFFGKFFKRLTGLSPMEYRNGSKAGEPAGR